ELLEQSNRMGKQMNIQFVAVKPLDEEEGPGFRRYPFLIETRAAYPELVNFVDRIENGLRLSLGDLKIEADKKTPAMHRLQFTLNIFELTNDLGADTAGSDGNQILSARTERISVGRDPFSPKAKATVAAASQKRKPTKRTVRKRKRPKLVLMGIMDIGGRRRAIINNRALRSGETIEGQRIGRIEEDHVIVEAGGRAYPLYLKIPASKKREVKR
ncbi:MAG: type 4a pilus biogenesis protein PilO, partial [Deltaproteobacteria bacterium]|nr:type 4a pilus biogenesis protein PilO [Deltaproteobacteria bacterium]